MKKLILAFLILLPCAALYAEIPAADTIDIGRDLRTGGIIRATRYTMPGVVQQYRAYPENGTIVYSLLLTNKKGTKIKPKGSVRGYTMDHSAKAWEESFAWMTDYVSFEDRFVIMRGASNMAPYRYIFPINGHELASLRTNPLCFIYPRNMIISSKISDNAKSNVLYGHTMGGQQIWERKVKKNFNWTGYEFIDDSSILVSGSGLFRLNLDTGKGWELSAVTHNVDKLARGAFWASVGVALVGAVAAGATGGGVYAYGGPAATPSKLTEISSNVCIVNEHVFWASKENIYKIDLETGEVLWQSPLPEEMSSTSYIIPGSRFLYLLNTGFVRSYTGERAFGTSYVAKYDSSSGELEFRTEMPEVIRNIAWNGEDDNMVVFTADYTLNKFSLSSGELISSDAPDGASSTHYFMVRRDLVKRSGPDGKYLPLTNIYGANAILISDGERVLCYDENLSVTDSFPIFELFVPYAEIDSYLLAGNTEINILLNISFDPVAEFDYPGKFSIAGTSLFGNDRKEMYRIDLSEILPVGTDFDKIMETGTDIYPYDVIY